MASTTNPKQITPKQPAEVIDYNFDFTDLLADITDTIQSSTVTVDDPGLLLGDTVTGTTIVKQWASAGVDGKTYRLTCVIVTVGHRTLEAEIFLKVKEA